MDGTVDSLLGKNQQLVQQQQPAPVEAAEMQEERGSGGAGAAAAGDKARQFQRRRIDQNDATAPSSPPLSSRDGDSTASSSYSSSPSPSASSSSSSSVSYLQKPDCSFSEDGELLREQKVRNDDDSNNRKKRDATSKSRKRRRDNDDDGGDDDVSGREQPHNNNEDAVQVGQRIEIWWPDDACFYKGVVASKKKKKKNKPPRGSVKVEILYDDGESETVDLSKERYNVLGDYDDASEYETDDVVAGSRVRVYWPVYDKYYEGTVTKIRNKRWKLQRRGHQQEELHISRKMFRIEYDDGEVEWTDLGRRKHQVFLGDGGGGGGIVDNYDEERPTTPVMDQQYQQQQLQSTERGMVAVAATKKKEKKQKSPAAEAPPCAGTTKRPATKTKNLAISTTAIINDNNKSGLQMFGSPLVSPDDALNSKEVLDDSLAAQLPRIPRIDATTTTTTHRKKSTAKPSSSLSYEGGDHRDRNVGNETKGVEKSVPDKKRPFFAATKTDDDASAAARAVSVATALADPAVVAVPTSVTVPAVPSTANSSAKPPTAVVAAASAAAPAVVPAVESTATKQKNKVEKTKLQILKHETAARKAKKEEPSPDFDTVDHKNVAVRKFERPPIDADINPLSEIIIELDKVKLEDASIFGRCRELLQALDDMDLTFDQIVDSKIPIFVRKLVNTEESGIGPRAKALVKKWRTQCHRVLRSRLSPVVEEWQAALRDGDVDTVKRCVVTFLSLWQDSFAKTIVKWYNLRQMMFQSFEILEENEFDEYERLYNLVLGVK